MFIFISRDMFRSIYKLELILQEVVEDFKVLLCELHWMTENRVTVQHLLIK